MIKALRQALLLVGLAVVAGVLSGWLHPRAPGAPWRATTESRLAISWEQVRALPAVQWVDARPAHDFAADHVPGAIHLSEDEWTAGFEELILNWTPDRIIVVYCDAAACHASEAVAQRLRRDLATSQVYYLEGGWAAWQAHNPQ